MGSGAKRMTWLDGGFVVNWANQDEPSYLQTKGVSVRRRFLKSTTSRVRGDSYARFCEGPVVKFLRPTRRPYLGLVPKQEDSGDSQPQLGISKAGDVMLRRLLVGSAHYILGPFGPDTDLRRYGLRLCERGGKNAKKRAAVAVARKLAVLLHRLWVSGEVYEPLRSVPLAVTAQEAAA